MNIRVNILSVYFEKKINLQLSDIFAGEFSRVVYYRRFSEPAHK